MNTLGEPGTTLAYHLGGTSQEIKLKTGVVVTVDLTIDKLSSLSIAVDGVFYPKVYLPSGKEFAIAASLWNNLDCVEIIQFMKL